MSYYFAIALKDSVLFGCDRTFNDKITGENRSDSKRYSILSNDRVFLPTGNMVFCVDIQNFMHSIFWDSLEAFEVVASEYSKLLSSIYQKVKEDDISKLEAIGKAAYTETDCLYGGLNNGVPFIISLSSVYDFQLKLIKPISFIALNQSPRILEYVKKTLQAFMGTVSDKGTDEVWDLGRRFLPSIIRKISKADPLVSVNGDLIFLSGEGVKEYEF